MCVRVRKTITLINKGEMGCSVGKKTDKTIKRCGKEIKNLHSFLFFDKIILESEVRNEKNFNFVFM